MIYLPHIVYELTQQYILAYKTVTVIKVKQKVRKFVNCCISNSIIGWKFSSLTSACCVWSSLYLQIKTSTPKLGVKTRETGLVSRW